MNAHTRGSGRPFFVQSCCAATCVDRGACQVRGSFRPRPSICGQARVRPLVSQDRRALFVCRRGPPAANLRPWRSLSLIVLGKGKPVHAFLMLIAEGLTSVARKRWQGFAAALIALMLV